MLQHQRLLLIGAMVLVLGCATPQATRPAVSGPPAEQAIRGGTLQIPLEGPYRTLDVQQEFPPFGLRAAGPAYDTILKFDPSDPLDSEIVGSLAEVWERVDDRTYVFKFRKDVKWHDGMPFSAEDARFTLERITNPPRGIASARRDWFTNIERLEVLDSYTLKIALKRPQAAFLPFLAAGWTVVVPKHVLEQDQEALVERAVGTGPYRLEKVLSQVEGILTRNDGYFVSGRPYLDGIRWVMITEPSTQLAAFRAHRVDFMQLNNAPHAETVRNEVPGVVIQNPPSSLFVSLRLNHGRAPFDDSRVRQAIHLAIDRSAVLQGAVQGHGHLPALMPPGGHWSTPAPELLSLPGFRKPKDQDITAARQLLTAAGYPDGFTATMLLGQYPYVDAGALVVVDQLKSLGIRFETEKTDPSSIAPRLQGRAFQTAPYLMGVRLDDPTDPLVANYRTGSARNWEGFSDRTVDDLLERQSETLDVNVRKELVRELTRQLFQQVPQIPLFWVKIEVATHPWMKGFVAHGNRTNDYQFLETWIDPRLKP